MMFVIFTFSKHHIETVLNFFETYIPQLQGTLTKSLEKQKEALWKHKETVLSVSYIKNNK